MPKRRTFWIEADLSGLVSLGKLVNNVRVNFRDATTPWLGRITLRTKIAAETASPIDFGRTQDPRKAKRPMFRDQWGWRMTRSWPTQVSSEVTNSDERKQWILFPTKEHPIPLGGRGPKDLYFYWLDGPFGAGFYELPYVNHPGTKGNPVHERALELVDVDAQIPGLVKDFVFTSFVRSGL